MNGIFKVFERKEAMDILVRILVSFLVVDAIFAV